MKVLIVGLGIGNLYKNIYHKKLFDITTVDIEKPADYWDIQEVQGDFDICHICTPNFTHEAIARQVADKCKIVFIEKPGLETVDAWESLNHTFPNTRFMMVKNNQYRTNVAELYILARRSDTINLNWHNFNRIPNPGSWFTDKRKAWGGVSRDLLPHLLSWVQVLEPEWYDTNTTFYSKTQEYSLDTITDTDYGEIDPYGVYNVDDTCRMVLTNKSHTFNLSCSWKNPIDDKINIEFIKDGELLHEEPLGLCPELAYEKMVDNSIDNLYNDNYWKFELDKDVWIHTKLT